MGEEANIWQTINLNKSAYEWNWFPVKSVILLIEKLGAVKSN